MGELQAGLWQWQAWHPDWTPGEPWPKEVSSYAIDDGARLLLFDPLSVPNELLELAADRESMVVLTAPWHERDTQSLVERLGVPVFVPPPDTADDLVSRASCARGISPTTSPELGVHAADVAVGQRGNVPRGLFELTTIPVWIRRRGSG